MPWCMDCISMNYKDRLGRKAKCMDRGNYYDPYSSAICSNFKENNISRSELKRRYDSTDPNIKHDYSKESTSNNGCYLTTAICNCLNYEDDCNYLECLRKFRDNVMLKDEKYYPLLAEYNIVGPLIANSLTCDKNNKEISTNILINYIVPVFFKIKNNKYNEAVNIYKQMVNNLKQYYGYDNIVLLKDEKIDYPKIKTKKDIQKLTSCYKIKRI